MRLSKTLIAKTIALQLFILIVITAACSAPPVEVRDTNLFTNGWKFNLGDITQASNSNYDDSNWRLLNLPHDWSIEGEFSKDNPATPGDLDISVASVAMDRALTSSLCSVP